MYIYSYKTPKKLTLNSLYTNFTYQHRSRDKMNSQHAPIMILTRKKFRVNAGNGIIPTEALEKLQFSKSLAYS